jgi:hypothetical protein
LAECRLGGKKKNMSAEQCKDLSMLDDEERIYMVVIEEFARRQINFLEEIKKKMERRRVFRLSEVKEEKFEREIDKIEVLVGQLKIKISRQFKESGQILERLWEEYKAMIGSQQESVIVEKDALIKSLSDRIIQLNTQIHSKNINLLKMTKNSSQLQQYISLLKSKIASQNELILSKETEIASLNSSLSSISAKILFWLPSFSQYSTSYIKNQLPTPSYSPSPSTSHLSKPEFSFLCDVLRLTSALPIPTQDRLNFEKVSLQLEETARQLSSVQEELNAKTLELSLATEKIFSRTLHLPSPQSPKKTVIVEEVKIAEVERWEAETQTEGEAVRIGGQEGRGWRRLRKEVVQKRVEKVMVELSRGVWRGSKGIEGDVDRVINRGGKGESKMGIEGVMRVWSETVKRMKKKMNEAEDVYQLNEIKMVVYEEMISMHKTQIKSLYYYEQFVTSLIKYQKKDFRIELFKRLLIPDGEWYPVEILHSFLEIADQWSIDSVFSVKSEYISFRKAEIIIKRKIGYLFPSRKIKELIKSLPQRVFINGKKQHLKEELIPIIPYISSMISFKPTINNTYSTLSSLLQITPSNLYSPITASQLHTCLSSLSPHISSVSPSSLMSILTPHPSITFPDLLSFFHSSICIKVPLHAMLKQVVCGLVEMHGLIGVEIGRVYERFEDLEGMGMSHQGAMRALRWIGGKGVARAVVEVKGRHLNRLFDREEFEEIVRRFRVFEGSKWLENIGGDAKDNESED